MSGSELLMAAAGEAAAAPQVPLWVPILASVLGSGVISAVITSFVTGRRSVAETRRQGCSEAVEALIAWAEYPYRIRRRTSDEPKVLSALAEVGHELQERKARALAWVAGEDGELYEIFARNAEHLSARVGPAIAEAWTLPPVAAASGMVLGTWGPGQAAGKVAQRLNCAVSYHCGHRWRGLRWFSPLYRWRLQQFLPEPTPNGPGLVAAARGLGRLLSRLVR